MSAPLARNVLRVPGRLVKNPTDLSSAYPYGGTELGVVRDIEFTPGIGTEHLMAEEFKTSVGTIVTGHNAVLACVLRSWDNDMLAAVLPNVQTDAFGEVGVLGRVGDGFNRAGYDMETQAFKLLFAPFAEEQHRFILLHNAVPLIEESQRMRLVLSEEFGLPLMFYASPDSQKRTFTWDLKANLVL